MSNIISLDGYYEGPGKNVMVLPMDGGFDSHNLECMKNAGSVLLGHTSYQMFSSFWPIVAENPDASETNREFSKLYNTVEKIVISDKLSEKDLPEVWKDTTRIIGNDVYSTLANLKKKDGKDIVIYGSRVLWNDLFAHGLVDELHLTIGNVVLGDGTPLFDAPISYDDPRVKLHLLESRKMDNSENMLTKYAVIYK